MHVKRVLGLAVLVAGILILVFGVRSSQGINEHVVEAVKGRYTDNTMLYLIGGVVMIIVGAGLTLTKKSR